MGILIIVGCLLIGILLIGLSIYRFVKEIKEKDSKKDKWTVVAQNILGLFSDPLHHSTF
ncbi:Putative membrane protein (fragment) [Bacillus mycoides]|uniref:Membrane protein n=1 Tax=Bacillus mycoides TaxID=1405 RepID=A0A653RV08_BACMY